MPKSSAVVARMGSSCTAITYLEGSLTCRPDLVRVPMEPVGNEGRQGLVPEVGGVGRAAAGVEVVEG